MGDNKLTEAEKREILAAEEYKKKEEAILSNRAQRLNLEAKVTLRSQTNFFMGFSENISEGGIFISTQSPPAVGDEIEVSIPLPDGSREIAVRGIVRWHRSMADGNPSGCGVQFININEDVARVIQNMIHLLQKEPLFIDL